MSDSPHIPKMFGEVFADGQFRGHYKLDELPKNTLVIGDYMLWTLDNPEEMGIGHRNTGAMGVFKVADFEPYIKGFFGLNF